MNIDELAFSGCYALRKKCLLRIWLKSLPTMFLEIVSLIRALFLRKNA